jgi:5-methylcytosine-specific restriction endonuclease McrA
MADATRKRTCARCGRTPDEVEFRRDKRIKSDGLGAYCLPCGREYNREHYRANREQSLERTGAYYRDNRAAVLAQCGEYRHRNIDRIRAYDRQRSAGNPAKIARSAAFREAVRRDPQRQADHRRYLHTWHVNNRDKARAYAARRRMRERGFDGRRVERIDREAVWKRDLGLCGLCALPVPFKQMHLDHIKPVSRGGSHTAGNTQPAHPRCNIRKKDREVPRWVYATTDDRRRAESLLRSRSRRPATTPPDSTTPSLF